MSDQQAQIDGLKLRLDLLVIDIRELLKLLREEQSLFLTRPHLRQHVQAMELRLRGISPPARPWWRVWA